MKQSRALEQNVANALQDFMLFVSSEMVHTFIDAQPEGTLDRMIATWREGIEQRYEMMRQAKMRQTGMIIVVEDAQKMVLDLTESAIRGTFAPQTDAPTKPDESDDQPALIS